MNRRENTFRVDYSNVPKKPTSEEVHLFVGTLLGLKREQVKRIQCSRSLGCAFVKVVDLETAQKVVEEHGLLHEVVHDDTSYPLKITMEDGAVDVKVTDLSEAVSNATIAEFLKRYGDVISIHEQLAGDTHLFGALPTGVRVARMMVKTNIPSFVVIDSETTAVSYFGQKQTCRHCAEFVHNGVSCVVNKKLLAQKLSADSSSYASVAKQPTQTSSSKPAKTKPNELPKKNSAASKSAQPNTQKPALFKQRNETQTDPTQTTDPENPTSTMPPPLLPLPPHDAATDIANPAEDDGESDGSSASSDSRSRRRRQQPKKQKTGHETNTSQA